MVLFNLPYIRPQDLQGDFYASKKGHNDMNEEPFDFDQLDHLFPSKIDTALWWHIKEQV